MSTLATIDAGLLVNAIASARERVVLVAPAVEETVARAVAAAWARLGADRVTVILDVDAEVLRFGYGTLEGLKILQEAAVAAGQAIGNESGVRLCIVIADDRTFIFSPTPRLLENSPGIGDEPATTTPSANGLVLSRPPETLEAELGVGQGKSSMRTVGLESLKPEQVETLSKDLEVNPPKRFDLARAVNVYNARIRFVELQVAGCRLSGQRASLPPDLVRIAKANPALNRKIQNSIHLLDESDGLISKRPPRSAAPTLPLENDDDFVGPPAPSEGEIFTLREQIANEYLVHVRGGTLIKRFRIPEFEKRVQALRELVATFSKLVSDKLVDRYVATARDLADELLPDVKAAIPVQWVRKLGSSPSDDAVRFRIQDALLTAFGDPETRVRKMRVDVTYKDVTYEMLNDSEFISQISQHYPDLQHIEEYAAIRVQEEFPAAFPNP